MNDTSYRDAIQALKVNVHPAADDGEVTRQRIQASLQTAVPRQRRRRRQVMLLMAACLATSAALAFYLAVPTGKHPAPRRVQTPPTAPSPVDTEPVLQVPDAPGHPALPPPAPPVPAQEPAARRRPKQTNTPKTRELEAGMNAPAQEPALLQSGTPQRASSVQTTATDAQRQALYMTAHRLHFRGAPGAALSAWDAYLATAPSGPLAVEARYNRAVTLVRLGQRELAREALLPFANGTHGNFRKADATVLLKQLE